MKNENVKQRDSGIFTRVSYVLGEDYTQDELKDFLGVFETVSNYQYDIDARLRDIKNLACVALKEEGYGNITHFGDINLSHLKNPYLPNEEHECIPSAQVGQLVPDC